MNSATVDFIKQWLLKANEDADFDKDFVEIDPKELSDFGVDARYPGDMFVPETDETLEYKNLAIEIKELVEIKIEKILKLQNYCL